MTEPTLRAGRAAALLFAALLALPAALSTAMAQTPPAAPPAGSPAMAAPGGSPVQRLHQELHITPAQETDFNAFVNAMSRHQAAIISVIRQRPASANTNPLDNLRFQERLAAAQAESLRRLIGPFAKLYAVLSPAQKQAANRLFLRPAAGTPAHR
jgi:protein CpxP